jgi:hypothetical protein
MINDSHQWIPLLVELGYSSMRCQENGMPLNTHTHCVIATTDWTVAAGKRFALVLNSSPPRFTASLHRIIMPLRPKSVSSRLYLVLWMFKPHIDMCGSPQMGKMCGADFWLLPSPLLTQTTL